MGGGEGVQKWCTTKPLFLHVPSISCCKDFKSFKGDALNFAWLNCSYILKDGNRTQQISYDGLIIKELICIKVNNNK